MNDQEQKFIFIVATEKNHLGIQERFQHITLPYQTQRKAPSHVLSITDHYSRIQKRLSSRDKILEFLRHPHPGDMNEGKLFLIAVL